NLLAIFEFDNGSLTLTEAGTTRRGAVFVVGGEGGFPSPHAGGIHAAGGAGHLDGGGIEPLEASRDAFAGALRVANHTLKRALTDPHLISGIGNAYSDEILHRAQLSPVAMTHKITEEEIDRLYEATRATLLEWTDRLRA